MKPWKNLYFQVLVAIAAGVVLGAWQPETGAALKPLGDAFIKAIKMLIGPVIFTTVVTGIAGMGSVERIGRVGQHRPRQVGVAHTCRSLRASVRETRRR